MSRNKGSVKAKPKRTDREKLDLFISKVNELQNTRLAKEGFSAEYNIQQRQEQPLEFDLKQPDEADFRDYLMTYSGCTTAHRSQVGSRQAYLLTRTATRPFLAHSQWYLDTTSIVHRAF